MVAIEWNSIDRRFYEDGIDRVVLYPIDRVGVPWFGVISIDESPVGGEVTPLYYDGIKRADLIGSEDFGATINALSAPDDFKRCEGVWSIAPGLFATHQPKETFGFSYRTFVINGTTGAREDYKIHLVYGATAVASGKSNKTLGGTPTADPLSWKISTVPPDFESLVLKPTAHLILDTKLVNPAKLVELEGHFYGSLYHDPEQLSPYQIAVILDRR